MLAREKKPEYHARVNVVVKLFAEMNVLPHRKTAMHPYTNIVAGVFLSVGYTTASLACFIAKSNIAAKRGEVF